MRRSGERVLLLPAFELWEPGQNPNSADLDWEMSEYAPPSWMSQHGIPSFVHGALAPLLGGLPPLDALQHLTQREASLALQFENADMLGTFPQVPAPVREFFVTTSEPSLDDVLDAFERRLRSMHASSQPVELVEQADGEVWFWIEGSSSAAHGRDVMPLARRDGDLLVRFEPGLVVQTK
jgi:hypothetical protein